MVVSLFFANFILMDSKRFQRKIEDFVCQNCGQNVRGGGYTNHCPSCLWSRHVDVNPGDRQSDCGGMMRPITVEYGNGRYHLVHLCEKCGFKKKNKCSPDDNIPGLLEKLK
jgi:hypothetical protein